MQIPKTIYFLCLGPGPVPGWALENMSSWTRMNPEYQVRILTDKTRLPTNDESFYQSLDNYGLRGDVDRVRTLRERGGVYIDWDIVPVKPLGDMLDGCQFCIGYNYAREMAGSPNIAEPAFLASCAGHPILELYETWMPARVGLYEGQGAWAQTGPGFWTDLLRFYLTEFTDKDVAGFTQILNHGGIRLLPYTSFYLTAHGKSLAQIKTLAEEWPHVWGAHLWKHSWCVRGLSA